MIFHIEIILIHFIISIFDPVLQRTVPKKKYRGNGKLLLFGEYAVLDGAKALALPTRHGQSLEVKPHRGSDLIWESYDFNNELWFEAQISLYDFSSIRTSDDKTSKFIQKLLKGAVRYNTEFLNNWNGFKVINRLEFSRHWGLGSSSTVISNVAQWADVNPFHLHFYVSNGSGYDIACAGAEGPIVYQLLDDQLSYEEIDFNPKCMDQIYFVYLGRKQSSGDAIIHYTQQAKKRKLLAKKISEITEHAVKCKGLKELCELMDEHESIIATELKIDRLKDLRFSDFKGSIKSLGAWGGDFCMVASKLSPTEVRSYFMKKGCNVIINYEDMAYTYAETTPASSLAV